MEPSFNAEHDDVIDTASLVARCMGNKNFTCKLLGKFAAQLDKLVSDLEAAARQQDAESLRRLAHALKGSAANMSAVRLQAIAQLLEDHGRNAAEAVGKESPSLASELETLRAEANRVAAAIPHIAARLSSTAAANPPVPTRNIA